LIVNQRALPLDGLSKLDVLLSRKNQRFICIDTGWPEPGPERFTAHIEHIVDPPISDAESIELIQQIQSVPQLGALYEKYGSIRLYCDTIGDDSAFYIAAPEEWAGLRWLFSNWLNLLGEEEAEQLLPEWIKDYLVIGEIPQSDNYFLVPMFGDAAGSVFEFEHDGFEFIERGQDIDAFLSYLTTINASLIQSILGHTRYSDGVTDTQWLANEYQFDQ
jgi:hypothetical protein